LFLKDVERRVMKLHALLASADEAQAEGDISAQSPVFAVVRHEIVALDSQDAWHAISIVDVEVDSVDGSIVLVADSADDARDMSVASLRSRVRALPDECLQKHLLVRTVGPTEAEPTTRHAVEIVEAYADEHGLGLMLWFEGCESWLESQT
jgi:hypothetical protein